jgi:ubiquitin-like-conjugating enzyme ATG3
MQNLFHGVREYLTPVLKESSFEESGLLTPEEFVKAGDLLVYKCPTWRWESGDASLRRPYLPADKQYLVTRNVPCQRRVTSLELNYQTERPVEGEDEWIAASSYTISGTGASGVTGLVDELEHISMDADANTPSVVAPPPSGILGAMVMEHFVPATTENKDTPDLSSFEEEDNLVEDEAALGGGSGGYLVASEPDDANDAILYTRTYDLSITYDKYYQTPRVWLFGYDEKSRPLSADEMFEDIMQDYANRTVTMEPHPHRQSLVHASVHPCQHGAVMKRIVANMRDQAGDASEIRSDQYLFLFLKFIQSVIPTIDYDHTIEVNAKK